MLGLALVGSAWLGSARLSSFQLCSIKSGSPDLQPRLCASPTAHFWFPDQKLLAGKSFKSVTQVLTRERGCQLRVSHVTKLFFPLPGKESEKFGKIDLLFALAFPLKIFDWRLNSIFYRWILLLESLNSKTSFFSSGEQSTFNLIELSSNRTAFLFW